MEVALLCHMRKCLIWMLYIKNYYFLKLKFYYKNQLLMRISWTMNDIETALQELVREFDETVFPKDYRQMEAALAEYEELVKKV